jgi:short-subunit dehydrogenase
MKTNKNKSILITGASTGIGRECALILDKEGFKVYAGVRNSQDFDALNEIGTGNIQPVILDVCKEKDINDLFKTIEKDGDNPLFGIINNAGIGISGIIEATPVEELVKLFEVNLIGLHRVTKAMLPYIRKNKGRIINIGSSSSFFAGPGMGPYAASKFAVRAYNDALRIEMKTQNVHVSLVAPGPIESAIWDKAKNYKEYMRSKIDSELKEVYKVFVKASDKILDRIKPKPASLVAKAVLHALTSKKPKFVYMVNANAVRVLSWIPQRWSDHLLLKEIQKTADI